MPRINSLNWFSRAAIAFVYIYFGVLKILGVSPAEDVVTRLHAHTVPFIPIGTFLIILGAGEVIIGMMFLWPRITKITYVVFLLHVFTTILPLAVLANETWSRFGVPTLTGQYMLKNIVLIALATNIFVLHKITYNVKHDGNS